MKKEKDMVRLNFMVAPDELTKWAYVPSAIRCKIIEPDAEFLTKILGESGRKMVKAGLEFYFTKILANKLIEKKIAIKAEERKI